ncbi:hypothetical protein GM3709_2382 [Geminocystis sp. NIES-3709]|nr:hypothetical protein GM3709_2382 [Geminocystis sp. NIES-3709]
MVINTSSFRRYTPPTCTLEIYHPHSFWGNWGAKTFPPQFSFQLHFDDPRLPKNEKSVILGDRNLLEKLREKVNEYIAKYLEINSLEVESLTCELPSDNQEEFISISRDSTYRHRLFYQCFFPKEEILEIILTNTQLFDFVNALSSYYHDATKPIPEKNESISSHIGLSITITALTFVIGGGIWWRYEQQIADNQTNTDQLSTETPQSNIEDVIPPTPIDPKTIPSIVAPEVPENLKNRNPLLPPPPTITQPPQGETNIVGNNIKENNISPQPNQSAEIIIAPPPLAPPISNLPPPVLEQTNPNIITLQPSPSTVTPSFQPTKPLSPPSKPQYPSRLSTLPTLQPNNSNKVPNSLPNNSSNTIQAGINTLNSVSPNVIGNSPNFEQQVSRLDSSLNQKKSGGLVSNEVKQYFQDKWQPPENLKQSIEYRLKFSQNGSLAKVTPIGQVAIVFLDRTGIPLLGEKITSSFSDQEEVTVRLILSPSGNVQTFDESK